MLRHRATVRLPLAVRAELATVIWEPVEQAAAAWATAAQARAELVAAVLSPVEQAAAEQAAAA